MTIEQSISDKRASIAAKQNDIAQLSNSIGILTRDLAGIVCRGNRQEKANCEGRKNGISSTISARRNQIAQLNNDISSLNKEIEALNKQRESEAKAIEILAEQGDTPASVIARTEAQASAALEVSNAQARSIESAQSNRNMIIWIIGFVLLIIIIAIARKKLA